MKNLFLTLLSGALMFSACNHKSGSTTAANTTANAANAPVMKFVKETHDFGKINAGSTVTYDFNFSNTGKTPLIITDAYASCGCTKPTWPKTPIRPGESGNIHVTFDSSGKSGLQDKLITITANTNPAENVVHLIGEVLITRAK